MPEALPHSFFDYIYTLNSTPPALRRAVMTLGLLLAPWLVRISRELVESAIPPLKALGDDPNENVRDSATRSLKALREKSN